MSFDGSTSSKSAGAPECRRVGDAADTGGHSLLLRHPQSSANLLPSSRPSQRQLLHRDASSELHPCGNGASAADDEHGAVNVITPGVPPAVYLTNGRASSAIFTELPGLRYCRSTSPAICDDAAASTTARPATQPRASKGRRRAGASAASDLPTLRIPRQ